MNETKMNDLNRPAVPENRLQQEDQQQPEDRLGSVRVLLAGLGNIGSFLAVLLAPLVGFIRLVDRDAVASHNVLNQLYGPQHEGQSKVEATADLLESHAPELQVERRVMDLDDLPWGDFGDVDVVLAGLDSLRSRQSLSEKLRPFQVPYIDGAVGEPLIVRTQVLLPGQACLECSWGEAQYRHLATEYPCRPGAVSEAPRTLAPACAGAAVAGVMVAQCMKLFAAHPPRESYEINGDLSAGRLLTARRRRSRQCRADHDGPARLLHVDRPFSDVKVADLLDVVASMVAGGPSAQLEFRRGILEPDLFGCDRLTVPERLVSSSERRLEELGLTARDHIVVREEGRSSSTHVCFNGET